MSKHPRRHSPRLERLETRLPLAGEPIVDLNGPDPPQFPPVAESFDYSDSAFFRGHGPVLIVDVPRADLPGLTVTDAEDANLASARITIRNAVDGAAEVLSVDAGETSIAANYAAPTLTLTGSAPVEQYQQVLRTLRYENRSATPTLEDREVEVIVSDGVNESAPAVSTVTIVDSFEIVVEQRQIDSSSENQFPTLEVFAEINASSALKVSGFQIGVNLTPTDGGAAILATLAPSAHPYVFSNQSPAGSVTNGGSAAIAGDFLAATTPADLDPGDGFFTLGLQVDGGTPDGQRFEISITTDDNTFVAGPRPNERFPFTVRDGRVQVGEPEVVLAVSSVTPTATGFVAEFNGELDAGALNLYDTQILNRGAADVVLQGATVGPVSGSLLISDPPTSITFVKAGSPLMSGTYTVTLRSAEDGFKTAGGALLDGDGNGTAGGDFLGDFVVDPPAEDAITVSLPDFVRGPGQEVNLPADLESGIPITLSETASVRSVNLTIGYDPGILQITGATADDSMPEGATVELVTPAPGTAVITFSSPTDLADGSDTIVNLQANVPTADANNVHRTAQLLDLHSVSVRDSSDSELATTVDDAIHFVAYPADVSGNARINSSDAAQLARFAALADTGFASSLLIDSRLLGDVTGNGRVNAGDASAVARFAALIPVPAIPPIPGGVTAGAGVRRTPDEREGMEELTDGEDAVELAPKDAWRLTEEHSTTRDALESLMRESDEIDEARSTGSRWV